MSAVPPGRPTDGDADVAAGAIEDGPYVGGDDELTGDGAAQDGAVVHNPEEIVVNNAEGGM